LQSTALFKQAAAKGVREAILCLGHACRFGHGTEKSQDEAFRHFLRGAEMGSAVGQYSAALCLLDGEGAQQDVELGRSWLQQSAAQGYQPALNAVAISSLLACELLLCELNARLFFGAEYSTRLQLFAPMLEL
jgi:TPR repeat protein